MLNKRKEWKKRLTYINMSPAYQTAWRPVFPLPLENIWFSRDWAYIGWGALWNTFWGRKRFWLFSIFKPYSQRQGRWARIGSSSEFVSRWVTMGSCSSWLNLWGFQFSSVQSLSRVWFYDPMNCNMPGLPVHHQLLESTQTHAHRVGDAIQQSHPLLSPSPPAPNPSKHQGLFQWVNSSHEVAKVLEFQLQHLSFEGLATL